MKLTTGILAVMLMTGAVWGQNPDVIENTRNTLKAVQQKKEMDSNAVMNSSQAPAAKPTPAAPASSSAAKPASSVKPVAHPATPKPVAVKPAAKEAVKSASVAPADKPRAAKKAEKVAVEAAKTPAPETAKKEPEKPINLTGRRDPFVSPVVNRSMVGSGCSSGKRCLAIDQISLKGVVKSENGMIAVVVNALEKAYFLRENDPVFNGYVVKITGDSIIFKETVQDKVGKPFTREVTKRILTPAV